MKMAFPPPSYIYDAKLWSITDTTICRIIEADRAALEVEGKYQN
jgi:hypothetical protein